MQFIILRSQTIIKIIFSTWLALFFISQINVAQAARHNNRYYKQFKYAKEDFMPKPRFWGGLEYMSMWQEDGPLTIPVVTRNPSSTALGLIGEPGTQIIYGDGSTNDLNYENINGGRLTFGGWMDDSHVYGLEFSGFLLQKVFTNFDVASHGGGFPVVSIPYFETQPVLGEAVISAGGNPNSISVNTGSQLWGAEVDVVYNLSNFIRYPLELLVGFRYLSLDESLSINDTIFDTTGIAPTDGVVSFTDDFSTQNNFYGLELGLRSRFAARYGFTLDFALKVALGENAELIDVQGLSYVTRGALGLPSGIVNAGIFAQQSNTGSYTKNTFAVLPEAQIKFGYMLASNVHPYISYDVMYLNKVVRPGQQLDRYINATENPALSGATAVTGALSPTKPSFSNSNFYIQGITVGLEVSF